MSNTTTSTMPQGIEAGGVGARLVAWIVDGLVPVILLAILGLVAQGAKSPTTLLVAAILAMLATLGWSIFVWWRAATRAATPGMHLMGLQLVGIRDGKAIGWGRYFLRQLVLGVLTGTGLGGILVLVFLFTHPYRQGWHDLAAKSVVVKAPRRAATTSGMGQLARQQVAASSTSTVGLPPRLAQQQAGFAGTQGVGTWQGAAPQPGAGPLTSIPEFGPAAGQPTSQPSPYLDGGAQPVSQPSAAPVSQPSAAPVSQPSAAPVPQPSASPAPGFGVPPMPVGQPPVVPPPVSQPLVTSVPVSAPPAEPVLGPVVKPISAVPVRAVPPSGDVPPVVTPPPATYQPGQGGTDDNDFGGTHLASATPATPARPAAEGWVVTFDDGRAVPVTKPILVGRNPVAGGLDAELVALGASAQKVSKTHLEINVDERGLYVTDRGSTNGTAVVLANGDYAPCVAGEKSRLAAGQTVSFGDHTFRVSREA